MFTDIEQYNHFNELAYARFEERKRVTSVIKSILIQFPEQFSSRKRHRIATEVCNILYKEIEDKFDLF